MEITVTRHMTDGFTLSTTYKGQYYHCRYMGYTVREAKTLFREVVKEQSKKG